MWFEWSWAFRSSALGRPLAARRKSRALPAGVALWWPGARTSLDEFNLMLIVRNHEGEHTDAL